MVPTLHRNMNCFILVCVLFTASASESTELVLGSVAFEQQGFLQKPGDTVDLPSNVNKLDGEPARELYGYRTTRHQSWFARMKNAFIEMGVGFVLIVFSLPVIWVNESRNAQLECVISCGERDCIKSDGAKAQLVTQRGSLLHLEGEQAKAAGPVKDGRFDVRLNGALRLQTVVEVYQWIEEKREEEQDELGGGKTTVTTYNYKTDWAANYNDGSSFAERNGHTNTKPNGLREAGIKTVEAEVIDIGNGHTLPQQLTRQLNGWKSADQQVGKTATLQGGTDRWSSGGDKYYYSRQGAGNSPQVGDARAQFSYIPDGPVTVMALQVEGTSKDTFLPYRLVSRGCCGNASEEEVKNRLIEESKVSRDVLAERSQWNCGPLTIFCCACNIVNNCFAHIAYPEIFHAWDGSVSRDECFRSLREQANCMKWGFRFGGWLMMYAGMCMVFSPLVTMLAVIPFLSHCSSYIVCFFCFIASVTISCVLMSMAYMAYHPLYAIMQLLIVAAIAAAINYMFYRKAINNKNA